MMKKLRNYFFTGLFVVLPLFVTILIVFVLMEWLNNLLLNPMIKVFRPYLEHAYLIVLVKIVAFILALLFIAFIGVTAKTIFARRLIRWFENIVLKVPIVNKVYSATKEIRDAFLGQKTGMFKEVVMIEYPRKGIYAIGFVASKAIGEMQEKTPQDVLNVFVPTSPNPTTGVVVLVPKEDVTYLHMSVEQGLKFVISCGAVSPENIKSKSGNNT